MSDDDRTGALAGVRVLELGPGVAGAYCAKLFADMGALVYRVLALPYVSSSWAVLEGSPEGQNGIPAVFILKSFMLVFAALVALQGAALALKSLALLRGDIDAEPAHEDGGHGV